MKRKHEWLEPIYSNQKSFYRKAEIIRKDHMIYLRSYDTIVCGVDTNRMVFEKYWDGFSRTTMIHIKDFVYQFVYGGKHWDFLNKKYWEEYPLSIPLHDFDDLDDFDFSRISKNWIYSSESYGFWW